ncbi:cytochrome c1 [Polycladidibacter hongkongensis]|uniref:cytochrome c1 n=1 Tax=Polycladidibacter hongkongensis TaxID=1647556 RepID=UPI000B2E60EB|nr:cytochrome c1 [Pseudovibrio hongkongensis]
MKKYMFNTARVAALVAGVALSGSALAAGAGPHIEEQKWSFSGPFGQFDKAQLQRGFQVYKEVCSSCHSLNYVAFRNLAEEGGPGFSEEEVKALAAEYTVVDGPNEDGDMFERPAKPFDRFPAPFENDEQAKASNGGALPPDLSLIAKARATGRGWKFFSDLFTQYQESGPDYLYNLLTSYEEEFPACAGEQSNYFNPKFIGGTLPAECAELHLTGGGIAMAPPLFDEAVEYADGTPMTTDQYARDVSAFLMWTAEPKLDQRKQLGLGVLGFLMVFASLLYYSKRKIWRDVDH